MGIVKILCLTPFLSLWGRTWCSQGGDIVGWNVKNDYTIDAYNAHSIEYKLMPKIVWVGILMYFWWKWDPFVLQRSGEEDDIQFSVFLQAERKEVRMYNITKT